MKTSLLILAAATLPLSLVSAKPPATPVDSAAPAVSDASDAADTASKPAVKPRTPEDAVTPFDRNHSKHEHFLERIKQGGDIGLLFLGDSITARWLKGGPESWEKFAPYHAEDFGISGERTEDVLWRITNGELDGIKPQVVVVLIGTNNIGKFPNEEPAWVAAGIRKIVETVHVKLPGSRVLLLGVFPRGKRGSVYRDKIAAINQIISKLDDGGKTRYLDIGKVFLDGNGDIPKDIMPDTLHPSAKGYDLWYEAMNPLLSGMLRDANAPGQPGK